MENGSLIKSIEDLIITKLKEPDFEDCFIVDIEHPGPSQLKVFLDSDKGINTARCARVSRYLEHEIEEQNWMPESYLLEVSSPGLDRPLKFPRQYKKNVDRKLQVHLTDGDLIEGLLRQVTESEISVETTRRERVGKKKMTIREDVVIPFDKIEKTFVQISFGSSKKKKKKK